MQIFGCHILTEQSISLHDVLKALQCIIGLFQTQSSIWKFSNVRESIQQSKGMNLTFLMLNVLEAKIFQYGFLL